MLQDQVFSFQLISQEIRWKWQSEIIKENGRNCCKFSPYGGYHFPVCRGKCFGISFHIRVSDFFMMSNIPPPPGVCKDCRLNFRLLYVIKWRMSYSQRIESSTSIFYEPKIKCMETRKSQYIYSDTVHCTLLVFERVLNFSVRKIRIPVWIWLTTQTCPECTIYQVLLS